MQSMVLRSGANILFSALRLTLVTWGGKCESLLAKALRYCADGGDDDCHSDNDSADENDDHNYDNRSMPSEYACVCDNDNDSGYGEQLCQFLGYGNKHDHDSDDDNDHDDDYDYHHYYFYCYDDYHYHYQYHYHYLEPPAPRRLARNDKLRRFPNGGLWWQDLEDLVDEDDLHDLHDLGRSS
ncbi:hypothetical protein AK812_SmicGene18001 [Symbiodinium microadriaticum]|uniref:Uncharacterized protein n=1 Tax=Symbiodinium microadriaticum TaxID=2951 RepID=A0A1Q9DW90_SYMMI|nr:hypothetical protein AK812_SmicGene18001 [Symbiodinium microadriaticum]